MIKCIAVDDEPKGLEVIRNHVDRTEFLDLLEVFLDPLKALSYLNQNQVDVIFLDINMPEIDGFQLLKHLPGDIDVIFTTAHSEYALKSYEVEATDYLLKPFDYSRFLLAVNKIKNRLNEQEESSSSRSFIFVNTGTAKQKILLDDILYIESDGNYVHYTTKERKYMIRASIKETLQSLSPSLFAQIHRSFIISIQWIDKIEDNHAFVSDRKIPIGQTYKDEFLKIINAS